MNMDRSDVVVSMYFGAAILVCFTGHIWPIAGAIVLVGIICLPLTKRYVDNEETK